MNDEPAESLFTRYVLENPWPAGIFLLLTGFALVMIWFNRGENRLFTAAAGSFALGGLVFLIAWLVQTPGEQAREVVREMVGHAEQGEVDEMIEMISPDASLHLGSLKRPGRSFSQLEASLRTLEAGNRISSNTITRLRGWSTSSDSALVQLGCRTETAQGWSAVPTSWMFELERAEDGEWSVTRIAFRSLAGKEPTRILR